MTPIEPAAPLVRIGNGDYAREYHGDDISLRGFLVLVAIPPLVLWGLTMVTDGNQRGEQHSVQSTSMTAAAHDWAPPRREEDAQHDAAAVFTVRKAAAQ